MTPSSAIYPPHAADSWRAWLDVDVAAVRRNAARLRAVAGVPLVAMVKADGYGTGMLEVVRALGTPWQELPAVDAPSTPWALGVATLQEAADLRAAGSTARVLCTTPLMASELAEAVALQVTPALHRPDDIRRWHTLGGGAWHLSIDTGMARAGARWDTVDALQDTLRTHAPEGVFTHFHSADLPNDSRETQEQRFDAALATLAAVLPADILVHSDNSAALAARGRARGHLARPGIGLYGAVVAAALGVEPVVHLRARVIDVREVRHGESVSYGATWQATGTRRIATVALGHGDGYRQAFSNRGQALLHGHPVPVVGTVSMDMTMLDVTDLQDRVAIGDVATLVGRDGAHCLSADAVAADRGLSPYELLVGLRLRVPRRTVESAATTDAGAGA